MSKANYLKNVGSRFKFLEALYDDYVNKDLTIKEMSEKYGYSDRQIRYLIDKYLLVHKGGGKRKHMSGVDKSDDGLIIVDGKKVRKATLEDLMVKVDVYKERVKEEKERREKLRSTNKKVEK